MDDVNDNLVISLDVSYGQIVVFDATLENPFNHWTDQHVAQGFAWRPKCAAFCTLEEAETYQVLISVGRPDLLPSSVRVIDVPFELAGSDKVEMASVSDSAFIDLAPGLYQLRFEVCPLVEGAYPIIRLSFCSTRSHKFEIVRADPELRPGDALLLRLSHLERSWQLSV